MLVFVYVHATQSCLAKMYSNCVWLQLHFMK